MQRKIFFYSCVLFTLVSIKKSSGQYVQSCVDSFSVMQGLFCQPDFLPVCGCDAKTYPNACTADAGGILYYADGPCEPFAFRITPNPSIEDIRIQAFCKYFTNLRFFITDIYGKVYFDRTFFNVKELDQFVNLYGFYNGIYIIFGVTDGFFQYQKFQFVAR